MAEQVGYHVVEGVAFLNVAHPPVNALSRPVRVLLMEALDRAEEDDAVSEIVLKGEGVTFPAGADLSEYEQKLTEPFLRDLCERVEYCEKPVIALMHGTVYGGGFELALAAHYRLAARSTRVSLPEVLMGLTPSGGATQRLPRLAGAKVALDMMLSGGVLVLDRAPGQQLVDELFDGDLRGAAVQFCHKLREKGQGPRRLSQARDGFADPKAYQSEINTRRASLPEGDDARAQILHLVEAAPLLPFEAGLAMEQDAFEEALGSDAAHALRHSFVAERNARRFPARPKALPKVNRIAVLGPGPLAMQLAVAALQSGAAVNWGAKDVARLDDGVRQLREIFARSSKGAVEARLKLLTTGESAEMVKGADMILHAAKGQGDVPAPRELPRAVVMAGRVDALGLRFAPPVFATRLMEVIEGPDGTATQMAYALALAERLGKTPVHVKSSGATVAGRLVAALHRAADALVDLGADPYQIDDAVEAWGWSKPPFRTRDTIGLEDFTGQSRALGARNWSAELCEVDRKGWVAGAGFYDWGDHGARPSEAVPRLINGARPVAPMAAADVVELLVGAMANEGVRMLSEGMVDRASDIDVVAMLAQDFPRGRGGPMKMASIWGLFRILKKMERLGHVDTAFWAPMPLWGELVKNGRDFDDV
ncbi:enoyl-CoA hydratase-related protein [Tropicibacter naphthalenivorans]|uniref:Fatty acid oxidation complex subunit alpha n=1 Tax=Tropicibacter naphthalenivorans TaxID=441103 RepID=A0A0P1GKF4_9RHOB|nr:enoyl-CoA hydratase-related protein [Tropicibacter naphthalenivorans]CUH82654.1 Fatty acid oxidation complex subunit alpha [Tropicibacter naphthalenivorans]SMD10175.1 3-hydroxyacyl-CoA dehydrogenase [Tropicibacter naphthalenivorans]